MSTVARYIFSVVCASVICCIANILTKDKKQANVTVKLLSGIFLSITLLSPITDFSIDRVAGSWGELEMQGQSACADGQVQAKDAICGIIKQRTEAYILEKAEQLGVTLQTEITLRDTLEPERAILKGKVTPYEKHHLQQILTEELGIPKEDQIWR